MNGDETTVRLGDRAHARSGDKGDRANIGVVAADPDAYEWIRRVLTERAVAEYFHGLGGRAVRRYQLPNILALNFVIDSALGGGASRSLRLDTQGKALASALLELRLPACSSRREALVTPAKEQPLILREDAGPVAVLTMNRPSARNALSAALVNALGDALTTLAAEHEIRAVVLTGNGPTFCAGMDLKEAESSGSDANAESRAVVALQAIADLVQQLHTFPKPTVAALNGDAFAAGAGLAAACDFVVAGSGVRIGYPEVLRGLVAAVVLHDLVRQVGERRARALLLGGRPVDAETAERWGLINEVVAPEACRSRAIEVARSTADGGPIALATIKRLIDEATFRPAGLRGAAAISAAVRCSDEAREGMSAFLEKRPPSWAPGHDGGTASEPR